jgi:hypothetical protein
MRTITHAAIALAVLGCASVAAAQGVGAAAAKAKSDDSTNSTGAYPTRITFTRADDCTPRAAASGKSAIRSVADLVSAYNNWTPGGWRHLQDDVTAVLTQCARVTPTDAHPVAVSLVQGSHAYHLVVPQRNEYAQVLLGHDHLRAVLLMAQNDAPSSLPTDFSFSSVPSVNPIVGQLPDFVKALVGAAIPGGTKGAALPLAPNTGAIVALVGNDVELPFQRGTITETGTLILPPKMTMAPGETPSTAANPVSLAVNASFTNVPKTRFDLTAAAGAIVGTVSGPARMKVTSGKYDEDPIGRGLSMAAVAWHPVPYDSTTRDMTGPERFALLIGGLITPGPGIGTAVSIGVFRGLAANIGYFWAWVPTSANGSPVGAAAPTGAAQLAHKLNRGVFIGGNYVFGKSGS